MRFMPKLIRGGLNLSPSFSCHRTVFKSGQAIFQHGFIAPYRLTTHTIFAIGNIYNNMIFLIILVNLVFEARGPEADVASD